MNIESKFFVELAKLEEIEAGAIQKIETKEKIKEIQENLSDRSLHLKAMRVAQVQRARARKKEFKLLLSKEFGIVEIKPRKFRIERSSVQIKKPIEAVDRFKRVEAQGRK